MKTINIEMSGNELSEEQVTNKITEFVKLLTETSFLLKEVQGMIHSMEKDLKLNFQIEGMSSLLSQEGFENLKNRMELIDLAKGKLQN